MRLRLFDLASRIRRIALAAPVVAAWQPGCITSGSSCGDFHSQRLHVRAPLSPDGGASAASPSDGGVFTPQECSLFCESHGAYGANYSCAAETGDGGLVGVCSYSTMCEGRRPCGFEPPAEDSRAPLLGRYFARMAAGEAASIHAFHRLAEELCAVGMPARLVTGARRAAAEEARHYRMTAALAGRFGAVAETGTMRSTPDRTLFEMAVDNAREGVVRETIGAAFGWWQARHASERAVRNVMRRIADEETGHAVLSWTIHACVRQRLTPSQCADLDVATAAAMHEVERDLDAHVPEDLVERAGLPHRRVARALFAEARVQLWV